MQIPSPAQQPLDLLNNGVNALPIGKSGMCADPPFEGLAEPFGVAPAGC